MKAKDVQLHLRTLVDADFAEQSQRFFKTGKGSYGEGDEFLGIRVPTLRAQLPQYADLNRSEVGKLLTSSFHEERQFAVLLLVAQYANSGNHDRQAIYEFYLDSTQHINNWDLVDCSAHKIVGEHLHDKSREPLYRLAESSWMWDRRISIVSTLRFIRDKDFEDVLKLSEKLLQDKEDLVHKAVGWMLREVGKRDNAVEVAFLQPHYRTMPRTMLRYAIEKFPKPLRQDYLHGRV